MFRPVICFVNIQVEKIVNAVEDSNDIKHQLTGNSSGSCASGGQATYLSEKAVQGRRRFPTLYKNGRITLSPSCARERRKETFNVAQSIHGGSSTFQNPGAIGLIDTVLHKCTNNQLNVVSSSKKFCQQVVPAVYKKNLSDFESSDDNMMRSISVYYSAGIFGKQKYRKIYRDSCYKSACLKSTRKSIRLSISNCPVPRLVPSVQYL